MASKSTVSESDLKELKDIINSRFDEVDKRLTSIEKEQIEIKSEIKGQLGIIDARLKQLESSSQKIPDLAEKVEERTRAILRRKGTRSYRELKNWRQIGLALFGVLIGGIITYLIKNPNP